MKPACPNHPDRNAFALGLCPACYMKQRRAAKRAANARRYAAEYGTAPQAPRMPGAGVLVLLDHWSAELDDKFRAKIDTTAPGGCHLWRGTRNKAGYGMAALGGYFVLAHRLAHALATGDATAEVVMHSCDNPTCVNPAHLRSGTHMENMADMKAKGRGRMADPVHLRRRDTHPAAKPVQTPVGDFPSAALAAEATGLNARNVALYCQLGALEGPAGYRRRNDDPKAPGWRYRDRDR